ncbi:MAG TPA: glycosyltransferase family 2 protein [Ktedonobacteraceae bacterium]
MKKTSILLAALGLLQLVAGLRVVKRFLSTAGGERLRPVCTPAGSNAQALSVLVPVLNEYLRLRSCLEGLLAQGQEVAEILVVDGGSCDGTQQLVRSYALRDARLRLVDASPIPADWNGKAWGLHVGLQQVAPAARWVLTLDADVYPAALLVRSLLAQAETKGLAALSVATLQKLATTGQGLLHPSLLTTLVYRYGMPGKVMSKVSEVQANGQCFLLQRDVLESCGGFEIVRDSLCEDVTLARCLVAAGYQVGFYEAGPLVGVRMYENWQETWQNWTRSLPMHDRFSRQHTLVGLLEVALVQALPLPLFLTLALFRSQARWLLLLNGLGLAMRIGVLCGTARAYRQRPWTYWLSPLCDLPVTLKLSSSALQRRHSWRGRPIIRGGAK